MKTYHEESRRNPCGYSDFSVDDIGLENSAESKRKQQTGEKLTPNPTPTSFADTSLDALIAVWPTLNEATKAKIVKLPGITTEP